MRKLLSGLGIKSKKILNFFGYLMNRNYTVNTRFGKKKTLKPDSNDKVFTSFSGTNTFSYKGIVVVKKGDATQLKKQSYKVTHQDFYQECSPMHVL